MRLRSEIGYHALWLVLVLFLTLNSSCVYYNTFYNAKKYYRLAERENKGLEESQLKTQNYQKAIDTAAKVPELYPKSKYMDDALLLMGKCYYKIKQFPKAERKFEELITNFPQSKFIEEAKLFLGKSLIENKSNEKAQEVLTALINSSKEDNIIREANFSLGKLLNSEEKYLQAADVYLKIVETSRNREARAQANYLTGECYYKAKNYARAAEVFQEAAKYRGFPLKRSYEASHYWALSLRNMGDLQGAHKVLSILLKNQKFYSYFPKLSVELAEINYEMDKVEIAVTELEKITQNNQKTEESARAFFYLGKIAQENDKDYKKAEEYLNKVKGEKTDSPYADSAKIALDKLINWRNVIASIDSIKKIIIKDENLLNGIQIDTLKTDTLRENNDNTRKLFETSNNEQNIKTPEIKKESEKPDKPVIEDLVIEEQIAEGTDTSSAKVTVSMDTTVDTSQIAMDSTSSKPVSIDTMKIMKQIEDNERKLNALHYQLAEVSYFQMNNIDSSRIILKTLADSAEKDIASKSLYLLAHIEKQNGDSTLADSLYRILIERYGDTEYGMVVGKRLGIPIIQDKIDSGEVIFLEAERLYFTEDLPEMALIQYALVDSLYPQSPYAPKALYARAWIEEKEWRQDSTALTLLNKLVDNYPKDTLAVLTKKRLTRPTTSQAQTSTTSIDTTSEITSEQVYNIDEVDTPPICAEDSTAISALILSNRLYPSAALSAQKKGLVILKLTINKYGYPEDLEIAKEIPPGYQFGEKALEVVQLLHFTPGKIKNKLVAVRMEQRIKFEI